MFQKNSNTDSAPQASSAMETLTAMEYALHSEYDPEFELTGDGWTKRYIARRKLDQVPVMVTVAAYPQALNAEALAWQRQHLDILRNPVVPTLCPLLTANLQPWAQSVVSTLAGHESLFQMMRQRHQLDFLEVCLILASLTEALESACASGQVTPLVNAYSLYLAPQTTPQDPLRIGLPVFGIPLPFVTEAGLWPNLMAMPNTAPFVPQLARLACELLGLPVRGGRYRPIAQIGEVSSEVLRRVIDSGAVYDSVSAFMVDFAGHNLPIHLPSKPEGSPTMATISNAMPTPTVSTAAIREPLPGNMLKPSHNRPARLSAKYFTGGTALSRLRLVPTNSPGLPACGLVAGKEIWVGRSPAQSDFPTVFLPSNPRNDTKTQSISRKHSRLCVDGAEVLFSDAEGVNKSFAGSQPLDGKVKPGAVCRVMVGGEYDLEIRVLPSWWEEAAVWQDEDSAPPPTGAVCLNGPANGVYPCLAALVLTDIAFSVRPDGKLIMGPLQPHEVVGWFLQRTGGLWVVSAESDGAIKLNDVALERGEASPLLKDDRLTICRVDYAIKSFQTA